jgi:hypothetical protein
MNQERRGYDRSRLRMPLNRLQNLAATATTAANIHNFLSVTGLEDKPGPVRSF